MASPTQAALGAALPSTGTPRPTVAALATSQPSPTSQPSALTSLAPAVALVEAVLPDPNDGYGVVVEALGSGARLAINDRQPFPSASLYKLGVAWMVLRRVEAAALALDESIEITDEDAAEVEPYGGVAPGETPTVREALGAMLSVSSNAAAHALLRTVGRSAFNDEMERLGLAHTRVPLETNDQTELAETSAADIAKLLRMLARSPELGAATRAELVGWLSTDNAPDALRETLPSEVGIMEKTGNLDDASNVGALLQSEQEMVIIVVLDRGVDPGDARGVIAQLGQIVYQTLLKPPPSAEL